ncbi:MAG: ABC transporter substrate-binding protein, partial [Saprospiraceae bacterium]|nr:ABC transporter substrate-binding protein [Saprospiraceae bacterium]
CSFLPAATEMIQHLGLEEYLMGVTFECPSEKPKVVRSILEGNSYSSGEIESIVSESKSLGKSLYTIDEVLLQQIAPDIIFTQDVCEVCQIDTAYVQKAAHKLKKEPVIIPLLPKKLEDVYHNVLTIARAMEQEGNAHQLLENWRNRTFQIADKLRQHKAPLRRIMLMEWLDPIYNCGHWIPDQIAQAGGVDLLSNPSGYSTKLDWDKIRAYDPEVLVIAPCGLPIERAMKEISSLEKLPDWKRLRAVRNDNIYFVDSNLFTCPGTRLIDGVELLAGLFHPNLFQALRQKHHASYKQVFIS